MILECDFTLREAVTLRCRCSYYVASRNSWRDFLIFNVLLLFVTVDDRPRS